MAEKLTPCGNPIDRSEPTHDPAGRRSGIETGPQPTVTVCSAGTRPGIGSQRSSQRRHQERCQSVPEPAEPPAGSIDQDTGEQPPQLPGIIAVLGELQPGAVITEEGVAGLFGRHVASVKRAVQRGELPPPCRLFGQNAWTAGVLVRHFEERLARAAAQAQEVAQRLGRLSS